MALLDNPEDPQLSMKTSSCSTGSRVPTSFTKFLRIGSTTGIPDDGIIVDVPPRRVSVLPVEVVDIILQFLSQHEQMPLLLANKFFYAISARRIYHTISIHHPQQSIAFFQTALNNPTIPPLVRSLKIDISNSHPLKAFYRLFHKVLQRLPALVALLLDIPKFHSPLWIFRGCTFSLKSFITSMHCTLPLAKFLDTQPNITELTLRGLQSDNSSILPLFDYAGNGATVKGEQFDLKPTSLPKLTHFNVIHAGPPVIRAVVQGRPVDAVSIPLFPFLSMESLMALQSSLVPMRRLSLISFDPEAPKFLFQVLSDRFPQLEALHVVFLMTGYTKELLEQSGDLLKHFKSLKYITFMATSGGETPNIDESVIAKQWHSSCPTLKTIILPNGRVWFQGTPDWDCSLDSLI